MGNKYKPLEIKPAPEIHRVCDGCGKTLGSNEAYFVKKKRYCAGCWHDLGNPDGGRLEDIPDDEVTLVDYWRAHLIPYGEGWEYLQAKQLKEIFEGE